MTGSELPPIAIIADAHSHDMESNYDWNGITIEGRQLNVRSWHDTRRSSRVFNESKAALLMALKTIEQRGIKHVVLLGDYSDDGQIEASERLVDILRKHRERHGTHFFAIPGNHDAFGPLGKHQSTRFVSAANETVLVTSDPSVAATEPETAVLTPKMFCEGVADGMSRMSEFGLFRRPEYLHWESPFGQDDAVHARQYDAYSSDKQHHHKLVDASYLVEPVGGLWLLMIDANVFEPRNGQWKPTQKKAFLDSSDAGWNSVLTNKPYLIKWIADVCARADQSGKTLLAFSHYPILDAFADDENNAQKLFGEHVMLRRKPNRSVAKTLLGAGLRLHFSGHLHVNGLTQLDHDDHTLEDCAVPSLASFPPCYKIVRPDNHSPSIDTVHLSSMPLDPWLMNHYREENTARGDKVDAALTTSNYGDFLYHSIHSRVIHHYLLKEWPEDIAQSVLGTTAADLAVLMTSRPAELAGDRPLMLRKNTSSEQSLMLDREVSQYGLSLDKLAACAMTRLVSDWYCLRQAGCLARTFIGTDNLKIYQYLADNFADTSPDTGPDTSPDTGPDTTPDEANSPSTFFAVFLRMMNSHIQRSTPSATRERVFEV